MLAKFNFSISSLLKQPKNYYLFRIIKCPYLQVNLFARFSRYLRFQRQRKLSPPRSPPKLPHPRHHRSLVNSSPIIPHAKYLSSLTPLYATSQQRNSSSRISQLHLIRYSLVTNPKTIIASIRRDRRRYVTEIRKTASVGQSPSPRVETLPRTRAHTQGINYLRAWRVRSSP